MYDSVIERNWLRYQSNFKSMSNWAKRVASPFGDPLVNTKDIFTLKIGKKGEILHTIWRARRTKYHSYIDGGAPFHYQGVADLSTYKMFLEVAHHLLKWSGRLGMLVPSSIYTDQGSTTLRSLFLNHCQWEYLIAFVNTQRVFDIHNRFGFSILHLEKKAFTEHLKVSFSRELLSDLEHPNHVLLDLPNKLIQKFSPQSLVIIETQTLRDLDILEKLYSNTILLGDQEADSWQIQYTREFDMTNDSKLFPPLQHWEAKGYHVDGYGHWVNDEGMIALPLYEGRMIGPFNPSEKGWVSGKGRSAEWREMSFESKILEPQYLMSYRDSQERIGKIGISKISFMSVGSATNARSMYACILDNFPCGHSISTLKVASGSLLEALTLGTILNSFVYDYALRSRLGGLNLSYFVLAETPLILPNLMRPTPCAQLAARLNLIMPLFAPQWLKVRSAYPHLGAQHWRRLWAITPYERLRLRCILDAIIAELYGLEYDDFAWILRDDLTYLKGFWRVDKEKPKELRHTTLALAAFKRLKEVGLEAFCAEDWQFPEEIGAQLGPRFTVWQQEGTIEESWAECEAHALRMKETPIPLPDEDGVGRIEGNGGNGKKNGRGKVGKAGKVSEGPEQGQLGLWADAGL